MAVQTSDKKLNGAGLGWLWACVKSYVATLATTVETNRIKILGRVETLSPTASFAQNSLITVALETYINTAPIVGVPNHIVTHDNEIVTHNGEVVTYVNLKEKIYEQISGFKRTVHPLG